MTLAFVIIAISSNQIATLFQRINLPLITGLIFTGILVGPFVLGLIPEEAPRDLTFITEAALAFIAFAAGSELYLKELRDRFNSIKWNTFGQLVVTFVLGSLAVFYLADNIPYMQTLSTGGRGVVAALTGAIFVARSPASAIAVINELRAKGPFVQTVMGVTVVKDFIVIMLFSVCLSLAKSTLSGTAFDLLDFTLLVISLLVSLTLGFFVFGRLLSMSLGIRAKGFWKSVFIVVIGYGIYLFSHEVANQSKLIIGRSIHLEPLLMCILASFYVTNYSKYRAEFIKIIENSGLPIYVAFFTLTGVGLDLGALSIAIGIIGIIFTIRLLTMVIGSYSGGFLAKDPMTHRHLGWMPYITQAGVALGLTTIVATEWPDWGSQFSSIIIGVIVLNQFIGPPLFKYAIFRLGEDRIRAQPASDSSRDAFIFGFEPLSVALAKQLIEEGWTVEMVTRKAEGSIEEPEGIKIHYVKDVTDDELDQLNLENIEAIVTLFGDEHSLRVCEYAYHKHGTRDLIVRIEDRANSAKFMALDAKILDPSTAVLNLLDHFVRSPQATSLLLGMEKGQDTRDIEILDSNLHGIHLRDLRLPQDVIILSVRRGGQTIITHGYTRLRIHDVLTVVGSVESLEDVQYKFDT